MADVLSQNQIDALLNSMRSDNPRDDVEDTFEEEQVEHNWKKYDFTSPRKFTNDKIKLLKSIYDNYGRLASSRLNSLLRVNCEMEVMSVEEQRYSEFNNIMNENDIMMLLSVKLPDESKNPPMMVHVSQNLMVNMIDRMLGGTGDDEVDPAYTYTEIEKELYKKMMKYLLDITKDAWNNYLKIEIAGQRMDENPELFQDIGLDEPTAIIMLSVKMQDIDGQITFCIPGNLLMNIFHIIDKRKHIEGAYDEKTNNSREKIMSQFNRTTLEIKAELGDAQLRLEDVVGLKVGDVIDLNKPKGSDIILYVEEQPWFKGKLGAHNKNAAVKIEERINREMPQKEPEAASEAVLA